MQELQKSQTLNGTDGVHAARVLADPELKSRAKRIILDREKRFGVKWDADAGEYRRPEPKPKPKMVNLDVKIPHRHEADLIWLFNESLSSMTSSVSGAMLRRAELMGYRDVPCKTCWDESCGLSWGCDWETGKWCSSCNGTGRSESAVKLSPNKAHFSTERHGPCRGGGCMGCDHRGYVTALTALMPGTQESGGGREPSARDLGNYGRMSRMLQRLEPQHQAVLQLFFGSIGERYVAKIANTEEQHRLACEKAKKKAQKPPAQPRTEHFPQRIFAIYPVTTAGQGLDVIARARSENPNIDELDVLTVLENEHAAELLKPGNVPKRGPLLKKADSQARVLIAAALTAWRQENCQ